MIRKLLCFLLFCLAFAGKGTAQSIDSALFKWVDQLPIEKIYVQFDNRHYSPGQTIWFKSYLLLNQLPSTQSKNFYIDWYNSSGKLVGNTVVPIFKGSASGSFVVPKKMEGESINAIAYTQWMKNFDSAFYFKRQFTISNEHTKTAKKEFPETTVQFLPESGNTIIGVNCNMAFKAVNQSGLPENIKGVVKNKTGAIVSTFKSIHNGMGTFKYKPEVGEMYTAEWTDILGNLHETGLPVADKMGVSVIMEAGSLDRYFEISRSIDVPEAWKKLTVLAQSNGEILFKAIVNLSTKTSIKIKLPVFQFPSGITQLTIFDIDNKPLCERQFFVNNLEYSLKANVNADTLNVEKRGKNHFLMFSYS